MWLALSALAQAAPAEEVTVFADPFRRWDDTRWLIESELMVPFPVWFASRNNVGFRSHAMQVRTVVACHKDAKLTKRAWEVGCELEDVALLVTTMGRWHSAEDVARVQGVLDGIDLALTGSEVQLQVDDEGTVLNVDIEGLAPADNQRQRDNQEVLRQVLARVISGFHLEISQRSGGGAWMERNSLIMTLPSATGVRGSTQVAHQFADQEGVQVVQSIGGGTIAAKIPYVHVDRTIDLSPPVGLQNLGAPVKSTGLFGPVPEMEFAPPEDVWAEQDLIGSPSMKLVNEETSILEVEATFDMQSSGVAVFDPGDGYITERVWVVDGTPSSMAGSGVQTAPYRQVGRLRMLEPEEHPDLGPTEQVSPPGQQFEGMRAWMALEGSS